MSPEELRRRISQGELEFTASRSGGPGGQNVNKVSTRIELRFNIRRSVGLDEYEKRILLSKLRTRISSEGDLIIRSQSERSQLMNRKKAEERFFEILAKALTPKAPRRASTPTKASRVKRLEGKKIRGRIKKLRAGIQGSDD